MVTYQHPFLKGSGTTCFAHNGKSYEAEMENGFITLDEVPKDDLHSLDQVLTKEGWKKYDTGNKKSSPKGDEKPVSKDKKDPEPKGDEKPGK